MARRRADDAPLPVSLEAERSILGSLLLGDITMYANQLELLQADDLSLDAHRKIYRAMLDLRDEGVPIDSITLREHLSNKRELETVGGVAYLSSLIDGVIERPSIEHHGRIVRDKALLRRIIHHADAQINRASARGADPVIITREICQFAESLEQDVGGNENWRALFHSFEDFQNAPPLRFAIEEFAQEQAITLIGGLAGHGKTLVMLAMAQAMLEKLPLFDYFWAPRSSGRTLYLVPECAIGPFWTRLKLFRLEDYVRSERFAYRSPHPEGRRRCRHHFRYRCEIHGRLRK